MSDWDLPHEYAILAAEACIQPEDEAYADAKAWLAARDRVVAARALREAVALFADELGSAGSSILLGHADVIEKGEVGV